MTFHNNYWESMEFSSEEEEKEQKFDWKDYLAMIIALLQTVMRPFILLIIVSLILGFLVLLLLAR